MDSDRRKSQRVKLDSPYFLQLHVMGGRSYPTIFADISCTGIQLGLPPECGATEVPGDSTVAISDFPQILSHLDGVMGKVAWVAKGNCGITFERTLSFDSEELQKISEL